MFRQLSPEPQLVYTVVRRTPDAAFLNDSLPPIHGFLAHLDQTTLRFTVREIGNGSNGFISVLLGQSARLFNTVAVIHNLTGLASCQLSVLSHCCEMNGFPKLGVTTYSLYVSFLAKLAAY